MTVWADVDRELAAAPGTVSAYVGPLPGPPADTSRPPADTSRPPADTSRPLAGPPAYTRLPEATHYAASTMKVAVLLALHRAAADGRLDLDAPVTVHNRHRSAAPGGPPFGNDAAEDSDDQVWARLGGSASLRWLAERMIVRSGNLATNLCLAAVGLPAVAAVWRDVGATRSVTGRGIEDFAARDAGLDNLVTARDLAALLTAAADDAAARALLEAVEQRDDLAAGMPPGVRLAHKSGWVTGIRHGAGVVFPADAPPYVVVVCASTGLDDDAACRLVAAVSAAAWAARLDPVTAR
jgi:beta-lactamase class A